jgi:hypothetical protein
MARLWAVIAPVVPTTCRLTVYDCSAATAPGSGSLIASAPGGTVSAVCRLKVSR